MKEKIKNQIHLFIQHFEVLKMFVYRDFKVRFTDSWLGLAWIVIQPLLTAGLFAVIFGKWIHIQSEDSPYLIFCFCGLVPWIFVTQGIQRASLKFLEERQLISKVYFARIFLPISTIFLSLLDPLVLIAFLVILLKIYGIALSSSLLLLPLFLIPLFFMVLGIAALLGSFIVYYRDVIALIPYCLQVMMYLSPIVYSSSIIPQKWHTLYQLNPMVGVIEAIRWCCLNNTAFPFQSFAMTILISLTICLVGVFVFNKLEKNFADIL